MRNKTQHLTELEKKKKVKEKSAFCEVCSSERFNRLQSFGSWLNRTAASLVLGQGKLSSSVALDAGRRGQNDMSQMAAHLPTAGGRTAWYQQDTQNNHTAELKLPNTEVLVLHVSHVEPAAHRCQWLVQLTQPCWASTPRLSGAG